MTDTDTNTDTNTDTTMNVARTAAARPWLERFLQENPKPGSYIGRPGSGYSSPKFRAQRAAALEQS